MFEYMVEAEAVADEISKLYLKSSGYLSHELDKIFSRFCQKPKRAGCLPKCGIKRHWMN